MYPSVPLLALSCPSQTDCVSSSSAKVTAARGVTEHALKNQILKLYKSHHPGHTTACLAASLFMMRVQSHSHDSHLSCA